MKQRSNKTHCPVCNKRWEDCECDYLYPEDLIDEDEIENGFNVY